MSNPKIFKHYNHASMIPFYYRQAKRIFTGNLIELFIVHESDSQKQLQHNSVVRVV